MGGKIIFSRQQWRSWSTPSKLTAIGTIITAVSFSLYLGEKSIQFVSSLSMNEGIGVILNDLSPPKYIHGGYENSVNGPFISISWIPMEGSDAVKLYQSKTPGIDVHNSSTYEKVDYFDGIGVDIGAQGIAGRKYYFVATTVKSNVESFPTKEIMIDTSRLPASHIPSVSNELTPVNLRFTHLVGGKLRIEWDGVEEVTKSYVVYVGNHPGIDIRDINTYTDRHISYNEYYDYTPVNNSVKYFGVTPLAFSNEGYKSQELKVEPNEI